MQELTKEQIRQRKLSERIIKESKELQNKMREQENKQFKKELN